MIEPTKAEAYWHEKFVEIKNPHKENEVFRFYFDQPRREWVGLTDAEIQQVFIANSVMVDNGNTYMVAGLRAVNIGRAIEAKLKEKNT